jgi:hypothetical protein
VKNFELGNNALLVYMNYVKDGDVKEERKYLKRFDSEILRRVYAKNNDAKEEKKYIKEFKPGSNALLFYINYAKNGNVKKREKICKKI